MAVQISISDVVRSLLETNGGYLIERNGEVADILDIPSSMSLQVIRLFNSGMCTSYDLLKDFLTTWVGRNGNNATLGVLTLAFEQHGFIATAGIQ